MMKEQGLNPWLVLKTEPERVGPRQTQVPQGTYSIDSTLCTLGPLTRFVPYGELGHGPRRLFRQLLLSSRQYLTFMSATSLSRRPYLPTHTSHAHSL